MKKFTIAIFAAISTLTVASPAFAAKYTLNCEDATTGQAVTVDVEADSRAKAVEKTRNGAEYTEYDKCK
ncbi:hypothetical protein ACFP4H_22395 [Pseudophaeobacter arcticus]|uniref:hypothetical protein n=1 Tax=Pseudophaeobacter arcticus TaxID=385492 RepID=UPI00042080FA|nr:hypothetical protein [Pseudophaeobacter arcticus]